MWLVFGHGLCGGGSSPRSHWCLAPCRALVHTSQHLRHGCRSCQMRRNSGALWSVFGVSRRVRPRLGVLILQEMSMCAYMAPKARNTPQARVVAPPMLPPNSVRKFAFHGARTRFGGYFGLLWEHSSQMHIVSLHLNTPICLSSAFHVPVGHLLISDLM